MSLRLSRQAFRNLVAEALEELPLSVQEAMENVVVLVQRRPSRDQLASTGTSNPDELLGIYEGIPRTERDPYNLILPDRISLFQHALEECCDSLEELVKEVRATVNHEIAHHFGWSDEGLAWLEGF